MKDQDYVKMNVKKKKTKNLNYCIFTENLPSQYFHFSFILKINKKFAVI